MPYYDLYVLTERRRVKYPRRLNIPSVEAAHAIAVRMAQAFVNVGLSLDHLSIAAHGDFVVEVVSETGQTVLIVPGRWMGVP